MWKPNRILCLALAAAVSGCSSTYFVPPDSETRERFQSPALLVAPYQATAAVDEPVKGAGEGALSGAGQGAAGGALFGLSMCAYGGPIGCLIGLPLAAAGAGIGAIGGGIVGGSSAHPEEEVEAAKQNLLSALKTTTPDEALAATLPEEARTIAGVNLERHAWEQGRARNYEALAEGGLDSAVEVTIEAIGTELIGRIDPDLRPVVFAQARMLSVPEGRSLYERRWMYYGQEQDYFDAAADDAKLFRQELDRACSQLASRIVFDLYVTKGVEQKTQPKPRTIVTIEAPVTTDVSLKSASYDPAQNLANCREPRDPERPWEGYWQATKDDATMTLEIGEKWVGGNFEVRGRKYPISGTVNDTGYVKAFYSNPPQSGGGTLAVTFPDIGIPNVGSAGMGRKLAMYQGKVFRLCEQQASER